MINPDWLEGTTYPNRAIGGFRSAKGVFATRRNRISGAESGYSSLLPEGSASVKIAELTDLEPRAKRL